MKKSVLLMAVVLLIGIAFRASDRTGGGGTGPVPDRFFNPSWSPDGKYLAFTGPHHKGLYVLAPRTGNEVIVVSDLGSGYRFNWSPDGKKLGFKDFEKKADGRYLQIPSVYEIGTGRVTRLTDPVEAAGVPSFSEDGKTVLTVGNAIIVIDPSGAVRSSHDIGLYVNLAPVSPDGTKALFNDNEDKLWMIDLFSSGKTRVTGGEEGYFGPRWSPDGKKIVCSSISGKLAVIDTASQTVMDLGPGTGASWSPDGRSIVYSRPEGEPGRDMKGRHICQISPDGGRFEILTDSSAEFFDEPSLSPYGEIAFCTAETGKILLAGLTGMKKESTAAGNDTRELRFDGYSFRNPVPSSPVPVIPGSAYVPPEPAADTVIPGVPYMHQVYDTPNWFNGHWACNATSAMMCIAYYKILPFWDCVVSVPYSHVSHYGNYVSEIYSYNGYTYDISSPDPSGDPAWGGYGYIVRNDWEETRGYMRDYFYHHGLDYAAVDWSPTWAEYQAETSALHPTVFLSLITSSGHYTVGRGNITNWHTAIFNDPYGDKNEGYMNYNGEYVYYDWPGYDNGYENLNTMSCFIYARHALCAEPSAPVIASVNDTDPCQQNGVRINYSSGAPATRHDLYVDGSLAVEGCASGTTYDPGDTAEHSYTVRALNSVPGCFTDSNSLPGTDVHITCSPPTMPVVETVNTDKSGFGWGTVDADHVRALRGLKSNLPALCTTSTDFSCYAIGLTSSLSINSDDPSAVEGRCFYYLLQGYNGGDADAYLGPIGDATPPCVRQIQPPEDCD